MKNLIIYCLAVAIVAATCGFVAGSYFSTDTCKDCIPNKDADKLTDFYFQYGAHLSNAALRCVDKMYEYGQAKGYFYLGVGYLPPRIDSLAVESGIVTAEGRVHSIADLAEIVREVSSSRWREVHTVSLGGFIKEKRDLITSDTTGAITTLFLSTIDKAYEDDLTYLFQE